MKANKKRDRYTVEYLDKIEYCGSIEKAIERFHTLTEKKPIEIHVIAKINQEVILQSYPLKMGSSTVDIIID